MLSDCDVALNLNNKYVKALDRRAKALRKQAQKIENFEIQVRPGTFDLFETRIITSCANLLYCLID